MAREFFECMKENDEHYCAAKETCLEKNDHNDADCKGNLAPYYHPSWVAGSCQ